MIHFLRLIRPVNLVIIALTMYSIRLFFFLAQEKINPGFKFPDGEAIDYFLLVFSTVLIAAAGNIINDYFDLKADRINKPDKVIIDKYIKKRWAIILHWIFNFIAFAIAIYLGFRYNTFWYVFIHLLSINSLWFYSMLLKRKFLSGNVVVAALTALVPILCGVHLYIQNSLPVLDLSDSMNMQDSWLLVLANHGAYILILAFFAFFGNLAREMIKDAQDIEGDKMLKAKTIAIVLGSKKTLRLSAVILSFCPIFYFILLGSNSYFGILNYSPAYTLPIDIAILLQIVCVFMLFFVNHVRAIKRAHWLLKLSMIAGIIWPFYWLIIFE